MFYFRRFYKYCHSTELSRWYPIFQVLPCSFLRIIILSRPCSHFLVPKQKGQLWQAWRAMKTGRLGLITAAELSTSDGSQSTPSLVCNKLVCNSRAWKLLSKSCILPSLHSYTEFTLWLLSKTHGERGPLPHCPKAAEAQPGCSQRLCHWHWGWFCFPDAGVRSFRLPSMTLFLRQRKKKKPHPWRSQTDST